MKYPFQILVIPCYALKMQELLILLIKMDLKLYLTHCLWLKYISQQVLWEIDMDDLFFLDD